MMRLVLTVALLLVAPAVYAQDCAMRPPLPAEWSAFTQPAPLTATGQPQLTPGLAYAVQLSPTDQAGYAVAPHVLTPGTFGGVMTLNVAIGGVYRVAVGSKAWVDVITDGHTLHPAAHAEGAPCSAIRKTVDFTLSSGSYLVQISNALAATMTVEVIAK